VRLNLAESNDSYKSIDSGSSIPTSGFDAVVKSLGSLFGNKKKKQQQQDDNAKAGTPAPPPNPNPDPALLRAFGFSQAEAISRIREARPEAVFYVVQNYPLDGTRGAAFRAFSHLY